MKILGLIPARGGSKGIPKKNIYPLCGKPMIGYVIEKALKSKYINRLVVSTDDTEISRISKKFGAEVPFMRLKNLAQDSSPTVPVVKHALDWLKKNENYFPDIIVLLQANSPLMKTEDIDKVVEKQIKTKADVAYTLMEISHPSQWLQKLRKDEPYFIFPEKNIESFKNRQSIKEKTYRSTGVISAIKTEYFLKNYNKNPRLCLPKKGQKTKAIVLDPVSSVDIDNFLDLYFTETLIKKYNLK
ncbi:MAG: acylneuraminate cytidylyltransferase family protein [Candidatus Pacebacteria bacterium]|nr:acylneuraminate cytidylyltransferase family protein [Candidatus Paceibacterota bacterium]